jgi:hypothetical protein
VLNVRIVDAIVLPVPKDTKKGFSMWPPYTVIAPQEAFDLLKSDAPESSAYTFRYHEIVSPGGKAECHWVNRSGKIRVMDCGWIMCHVGVSRRLVAKYYLNSKSLATLRRLLGRNIEKDDAAQAKMLNKCRLPWELYDPVKERRLRQKLSKEERHKLEEQGNAEAIAAQQSRCSGG